MNEIERAARDFAVFDYVPIGVSILRRDMVVMFWDSCLENWTGISRARIVGTPVGDHFAHLASPKYFMRLKDIFEGGPPTIFSSQLHKYVIPAPLQDGELRFQHVTVTPVQAPQGKEFYALFAIQDVSDLTRRIRDYRSVCDQAMKEIDARKSVEEDLRGAREELEQRVRERTSELTSSNRKLRMEINERKQAEEALRDSEERYRTLFEESRDAIFITGGDGRFVDVNDSALTLFGYTMEEMSQMNALDICADPDGRQRIQNEMDSKGAVRDCEVRCRRKDGTELDCLLSSTVRLDRHGNPLGYQGIFRDVTRRKRREEELLRARKLESIGVLAGGIAHDFNNLLTAIMGNVSLIKMFSEPGDEIDERLTEVEKATIRAKDLTRQLLTFSSGGAPVKKVYDIGHLIKDAAECAIGSSGIGTEFTMPDDLWHAEIDEGQIRQVINNLIINACEAMPGGGAIHVSAENVIVKPEDILPLSMGKYIKISIRDEGAGIPEEHLASVFDPYFTTKETGTGLGLATAYSIIKNHNGFITVESGVGEGTTFYIYLHASERESIAPKEVDISIDGRGKILVMDDEEMVRVVAGNILNKIGYTVEYAADGEEAVRLYKTAMEVGSPFDVVILDLSVPGGMGGKEALQKLVVMDPNVKAIVSSGYSNDAIMAKYRDHGFKGVVAKPYTIQEIGEALHSVLLEESRQSD